MEDRRRFERTPSNVRVEMHHPAFGQIVGFAKDISDGGARVKIESQPIPPVGTVVQVVFRRVVGAINDEPVEMKIMHSSRSILGLMFLPR